MVRSRGGLLRVGGWPVKDRKSNRLQEPNGTVRSGVTVSKVESFRRASRRQGSERGRLAGGITRAAMGMAPWAVGCAWAGGSERRADGAQEDPKHGAGDGRVVVEIGAQALGYGQHPLTDG